MPANGGFAAALWATIEGSAAAERRGIYLNYLCHLYLAGDDADLVTGSFSGDFVKGRLEGSPYPPRMRCGIELHRRTDSFAERHPDFVRSKGRLSPHLGLYRSVLIDLFYDHLFAASWSEWEEEPLPRYLQRTRSIIEQRRAFLPPALQQFLPILFDELLPSYDRVEGIANALARMARRVRRANPLAGAEKELLLHYRGLSEDFRSFLPQAQLFTRDFLASR